LFFPHKSSKADIDKEQLWSEAGGITHFASVHC
jgi:hypothetical protein